MVEADESDGSFVKLPATVAVVTNVDPEHLDFYGSFAELRRAFVSFVANIPFYGFAALCIDHPEVQNLIGDVADRRLLTYGLSPQADFRATAIETGSDGSRFDVEVAERMTGKHRTLAGLVLPMVGTHNVLNALAAIAIAIEMGIGDDTVRRALASFGGVRRRFTKTGEVAGITVIDDYGHHPVEIAAVLDAARASCRGSVISVVQPHRYSRLANLFEDFCTCFNDADTVVVAHVYPAGEDPIEGIDRDALAAGLQACGHRDVRVLDTPDALAPMVAGLARAGDIVVCLGAGNITGWATALPGQLAALIGPDAALRGAGNREAGHG